MAGDFKQRYKNRAAAFREFILPQKLPVSQSKFFQDCGEHKMVNTDKSVDLATLLGYVRDVLKVDVGTGKSLAERNRSEEMEDLELRKLKAETEKRERENEDAARALDRKWLHRDVAEENLAALVGTLQGALDHQVYVGAPALVHALNVDPARTDELAAGINALISSAFAEVLAAERIEGVFGDPQEEVEP